MVDYKPATVGQYDQFLRLMWDDCQDYLQLMLHGMQLTWEEYKYRFRTQGMVEAIVQQDELVGFYWFEERQGILRLHTLVLDARYHGQGIGKDVLDMLAERYQGRLDKIELLVPQADTATIRQYEELGFSIAQRLDDHHIYLMQKSLKIK